MTDRDAFLDVAVRIAGRIAAAATPEGDGCTWTVRVPDRAHPERMETLPEPAGGQLYTGTAGIALFLAELHAVAPDAAVADAARGGIRHALAAADALGLASFGFHAGRVGIACAAARMGELMDDPALTRRAAEVLAPMRGHEAEDRGLDVIGGAAGAIPALLAMPPAVDAALRTEMAVALGDRLAAAAERGPVGWSWPTLQPTAVHNLCGYAHGAAGAGHAFLELFHATGEGRFLYGAEQAFLYERRWMSAAEGNWPDLRHVELGDHLVAGRVEELRARLRAGGTCAPYRPRYMSAWCHGAPGIGLSRLRAYQLLGDDVYRDEARVAVETTAATLADGAMNFSLCHGKAGNAETLLLAADVLGDDALRARVEAVARAGRDAFEAAGRPWPCGTVGGVSDPSLLLGEAGIGHFYLRLHSPSVPSVLLPVARGLPVATRADADEEYGRCRSRAVGEWFGRSRAVMEAMGMAPPLPPPPPTARRRATRWRRRTRRCRRRSNPRRTRRGGGCWRTPRRWSARRSRWPAAPATSPPSSWRDWRGRGRRRCGGTATSSSSPPARGWCAAATTGTPGWPRAADAARRRRRRPTSSTCCSPPAPASPCAG
jgi:lantibiotic modifying enzyme